jgi:hypothetical protein
VLVAALAEKWALPRQVVQSHTLLRAASGCRLTLS